MSRVRVMRIIARLNIGGPAIHVVELSAQLDPDRFESLLVCGRPEASEGDMNYLAAGAGLDARIIPELRREIRPWSDLVALIKLLRLMLQWRPDIVHTHTFKAGALGRVAARLARVPVVVHTFHGHTFHGYWGCVGSTLVVWLERLLARLTDVIVTVSETVRSDLVRRKIKTPDKIRVVQLGLDLRPFIECAQRRGEFRAALGFPPDLPLVGIVGRLVPVKNHVLFFEAARLMVESGFAGAFVVVGGGELDAALRRTVVEFGLKERVHFVGWQRDLPRIYADLDVLVNSSINEGTPVAVIEAMAAGVPVVATAVGGVPDMIDPGVTGFLTPPNDPLALAAGIKDALGAGAALRDEARRVARERYSLDGLLTRTTELYDSLLSHVRAPAPTAGT